MFSPDSHSNTVRWGLAHACAVRSKLGRIRMVVFVSVFLTCSQVIAEGHTPPPLIDMDWTVFIQLGIFLLTYLLLSRYLFKPFLAIRKERSDRIDGARREAKESQLMAEEQMLTLEKDIADARRKSFEERKALEREAELAAEKVIANERKNTEIALASARTNLRDQVKLAKSKLESQKSTYAREIATLLLGRQV